MGLLPRRRGVIIRLVLLIPLLWFASLMLTTYMRQAPSIAQERPLPPVHPGQIQRVELKDDGGHAETGQEGKERPNIARPPKPPKPRATNNPNDPGEGGKAVVVDKNKLTPQQRQAYEQGWQQNAFNAYASDMISLHRSVDDPRDKECRAEKYPANLPDTSVIVCFHNEAWSVLLRTVHSVLDRSPAHLIREIILVDDFSDRPHLKKPLEEYVARLGKVRVVRAKRREGLIRARLLGASVATGTVLTYLDSHCECTDGWLEPLLARIAANDTNVVCPVIDVIDETTFHFSASAAKFTSLGGFDWNLQFSWHAIPDGVRRSRSRDIDPLASPTMAGGLFSISKRYFEYLGTYDPGMDIWGGENLELSFRVWMCGGRLEIIPCSHVGHVFRKRSPYSWGTGGNAVRKNSVRLAEVWLDDYKKYYYQRFNYELGNYGDVTSRKALRKRLQCKTFQWYLDHVYPYLFIPSKAVYSGEIRNMNRPVCVDATAILTKHDSVKLWPCHNQGGNQFWMMSEGGEIRRDEVCLDYNGQSAVITYGCHGLRGNQHWEYTKDRHIRHVLHDMCMEASADGKTLVMAPCSATENQLWLWPINRDDLRMKRRNAVL